MSKPIFAWHFVGATLRDGRPVPPDGEWLVHDGPYVMCESGLHASLRLIDALYYAPGSTICRVAVDGVAEREDDKLVATCRVILWRLPDADDVLRQFARHAALSVIHLWDAPDVVRKYLETGDERAAAGDAAGAAARAADWAADWAAAGAARAAARAAAGDADWAADWAAAWAARAAVGDARDKFNRKLTRMVRKAAGNPNDRELLAKVEKVT